MLTDCLDVQHKLWIGVAFFYTIGYINDAKYWTEDTNPTDVKQLSDDKTN